jgi:hypothetical protein
MSFTYLVAYIPSKISAISALYFTYSVFISYSFI